MTTARFEETLTTADHSLGFALDDLREALRDASPLEALVIYDALEAISAARRRAATILESRKAMEENRP